MMSYSRYPCILAVLLFWSFESSEAFGTFGFDIHHRYSDSVKDFLSHDGLPEKGSFEYYQAMAHRDKLIKARRLAVSPADSERLTFFGSNATFQLSSLGFLHYAIVTVGTPPLDFLVALDTGSDLFWLPCDCTSCARSLNSSSGQPLELNIYSPSASSTAAPVPCNSSMCGLRRRCSLSRNACAYQEVYLSSNTSSAGILVDDILHLSTEDSQKKAVNASITLGCGIVQTGDFLEAAAPNGLFGLGLDSISVPSILASKGLAANSFSMCFSPQGIGRIVFGDKGSSDQSVTPFNVKETHATYNVSVTQITVGENATGVGFTAIFDSGTSFTYLNEPAYSTIAESFNSQVKELRYQPQTQIIFEYCYALGLNQDSFNTPNINFTMTGGSQFYVSDPVIVLPRKGGGYAYCLAIVKSEDVNIIGQNFMTGYRLVFDREEMVLGWKDANCFASASSVNGSSTLPVNKTNSTGAPPPSVLEPEAMPRNSPPHSTRFSPPPPPPTDPTRPVLGSSANRPSSLSGKLVAVFLALFILHLIDFSSSF